LLKAPIDIRGETQTIEIFSSNPETIAFVWTNVPSHLPAPELPVPLSRSTNREILE